MFDELRRFGTKVTLANFSGRRVEGNDSFIDCLTPRGSRRHHDCSILGCRKRNIYSEVKSIFCNITAAFYFNSQNRTQLAICTEALLIICRTVCER